MFETKVVEKSKHIFYV